jgi:magnesium transporter
VSIDEQRRIVGVIDVSLFAEEILGEREEQTRPAAPVRDDVFEVLGFHLEQIRGASPWRVFRFRFPWLLVTVAAGTICAILAGAFEATLGRSLVVAFFLTMVLGLNESVSAQSMSVTIQMLRSAPVTWSWFATALRRELMTAILLGLSCGSVVAAIVWFWRSDLRSAGAVAEVSPLPCDRLSPVLAFRHLHRLKLDPKIAAARLRSLADICAVLISRPHTSFCNDRRFRIIPALNEEEPSLTSSTNVFETNVPSEIVVGWSVARIERLNGAGARAKVVSEPRRGYGRACLAGIVRRVRN